MKPKLKLYHHLHYPDFIYAVFRNDVLILRNDYFSEFGDDADPNAQWYWKKTAWAARHLEKDGFLLIGEI